MKMETILYEKLDKDKVRRGVCQKKCGTSAPGRLHSCMEVRNTEAMAAVYVRRAESHGA
jgi:hypothetical protein